MQRQFCYQGDGLHDIPSSSYGFELSGRACWQRRLTRTRTCLPEAFRARRFPLRLWGGGGDDNAQAMQTMASICMSQEQPDNAATWLEQSLALWFRPRPADEAAAAAAAAIPAPVIEPPPYVWYYGSTTRSV